MLLNFKTPKEDKPSSSKLQGRKAYSSVYILHSDFGSLQRDGFPTGSFDQYDWLPFVRIAACGG